MSYELFVVSIPIDDREKIMIFFVVSIPIDEREKLGFCCELKHNG